MTIKQELTETIQQTLASIDLVKNAELKQIFEKEFAIKLSNRKLQIAHYKLISSISGITSLCANANDIHKKCVRDLLVKSIMPRVQKDDCPRHSSYYFKIFDEITKVYPWFEPLVKEAVKINPSPTAIKLLNSIFGEKK